MIEEPQTARSALGLGLRLGLGLGLGLVVKLGVWLVIEEAQTALVRCALIMLRWSALH